MQKEEIVSVDDRFGTSVDSTVLLFDIPHNKPTLCILYHAIMKCDHPYLSVLLVWVASQQERGLLHQFVK
jgi:hypothetical protein